MSGQLMQAMAEFGAAARRRSKGDDGPAARARRRLIVLLIAVVVFGMALRIRQYSARHSYWQDEAMLVLNIFEKDAAKLLQPLDSAQAAPPAFLLAQRAMYQLFGRDELGMRLISFFCALAAMGLFAALAWRVLAEKWAAVFVVTLFACADRIIWHAAEAKQYSVDVLAALLLLWLAIGSNAPARTRLIRVSALAAAAAWLSHPAAFLFGGISLALLPALRRETRGMLIWLACNALFAASFLLLYVVSIRDQQVGLLYDYWARDFVDYRRLWLVPVWLVRQLFSLVNYPLDLAGPVLLPVAIVGGMALWRSRRQMLGVMIAPAALVLLASAMHRYPFNGSRLTLFLAPSIFLLSGLGLAAIHAWLRRPGAGRIVRRAWLLVPGYLLALAGMHAGIYFIRPPARGNIAPAVRHVASHFAAGDVIYCNKLAEFRCYWPDAPLRDAHELMHDVPERRFWLVLSYVEAHRDRNLAPLLRQLHPHTDRRDEFIVRGGTAMLFEPDADRIPPTAHSAAEAEDPR